MRHKELPRTRVLPLGCLATVSNFSRLAHSPRLALCDSAVMTYFSLAWLSEGTTAPFPLPYILEAVRTLCFIPLNTCQRKRPGKATISIATQLVPSPFLPCALSAPVSFFFYIPNVAHKSGRVSAGGELETVRWWSFFFFFSIAVPGFCSRPPCCEPVGAS